MGINLKTLSLLLPIISATYNHAVHAMDQDDEGRGRNSPPKQYTQDMPISEAFALFSEELKRQNADTKTLNTQLEKDNAVREKLHSRVINIELLLKTLLETNTASIAQLSEELVKERSEKQQLVVQVQKLEQNVCNLNNILKEILSSIAEQSEKTEVKK